MQIKGSGKAILGSTDGEVVGCCSYCSGIHPIRFSDWKEELEDRSIWVPIIYFY